MKVTGLTFKVGKRSIDDKLQIEIPGTLIEPDSGSDTLLLVQAGHDGRHENYRQHFGKPLGNDYKVAIIELRCRGLRPGSFKHSPDDAFQIETQLRDEMNADRMFYLRHCSGMNALLKLLEEHKTDVSGVYGMSVYPSLGDVLTAEERPDKKSLLQKAVDSMPMPLLGISDYPIKEADVDNPVRFAIAGRNQALRTCNPKKAARFKTILEDSFENSTAEIFQGKTHSFNDSYEYSLDTQFNKGDSHTLVNDIRGFVDYNSWI